MFGLDFSESTFNSLAITLVGALLAFLSAWFWHARNIAVAKAVELAGQQEKVLARLQELETQQRVAAQAVTPIIAAFQALLVKQLTHAEKPEMDGLMARLGPPDLLTETERARLMVMLRERTRDYSVEITPSERDAARILPFVMKMAATEQENFEQAAGANALKLVTIVSVVDTSDPAQPKLREKDEG